MYLDFPFLHNVLHLLHHNNKKEIDDNFIFYTFAHSKRPLVDNF